MTHAELLTNLRSILEGFEGVEPGQCSILPFQLTIEALATHLGGEVEALCRQIEEAYERLTTTAATGVAETALGLMGLPEEYADPRLCHHCGQRLPAPTDDPYHLCPRCSRLLEQIQERL